MADETTRPPLELVRPGHKAAWNISFGRKSDVQQLLFPTFGRALLVVMSPSEGSQQDFISVLRQARPRFVLDLRLSPRFDFGRLNRKMVFDEIHDLRAQYRDLSSRIRMSNDWDWRFLSDINNHIADLVREDCEKNSGPIIILVEGKAKRNLFTEELPRFLELKFEHPWEVFEFPSA